MIGVDSVGLAVAGTQVELTQLEFGMLAELAANAGAVLSHDRLLQTVWGADSDADASPVRTIAKNLRRKLGHSPKQSSYIYTVARTGCRMPKP